VLGGRGGDGDAAGFGLLPGLEGGDVVETVAAGGVDDRLGDE
jgi:hypothetical protein